MPFALGFIAGVATCVFVASVLAYFRRPIISALSVAETKISNAGPRPRGAVFFPVDESEVARQEIIRKNAEQGKDTTISELM